MDIAKRVSLWERFRQLGSGAFVDFLLLFVVFQMVCSVVEVGGCLPRAF